MNLQEICASPLFIKDGLSRFDLDQGHLGNCWFIAAAATLACKRSLFTKCVPEDQNFHDNYKGIFRFKFWQYGNWVEIVVDDQLPTHNNKLIFCKNRDEPNEFWPALFEKAYAKLYGGYGRLDGGRLCNALVDFTGGISEGMYIGDKNKLPPDLYDILHKCHQMNSFMGCSIDGNYKREELINNGLYKGHAYSVTAIEWINTYDYDQLKMIRVMNPWGKGEWKGDWSDNSPLWNNVPIEEIRKLDIRQLEDGEFWMSFEDWVKNFERLEIVHLGPHAFSDTNSTSTGMRKNWKTLAYHGEWVNGESAGGCGNAPYGELFKMNPQYPVKITQPYGCSMIVSLIQKVDDFQMENSISFFIKKVRDGKENEIGLDNKYDHSLLKSFCDEPTFINSREVSLRIRIEAPGTYVVIPSTFYPFKEGKFFLRMFAESETNDY